MKVITSWTGGHADALRQSLRMTNESFAEHLGVAVRTVANWRKNPEVTPKAAMQEILDAALERAPDRAKAQFVALANEVDRASSSTRSPKSGRPCAQEPNAHSMGGWHERRPEVDQISWPGPATAHTGADHAAAGDPSPLAEAERRLVTDPNVATAVSRLDELAQWEPGRARREIAGWLAWVDRTDLLDRRNLRRSISQRRIARALSDYYGEGTGDYRRYIARFAGDAASAEIATSILTCPDWLDLDCPLAPGHDRLALADSIADADAPLDGHAASAAAQRLAETLIAGTRFVDAPLYRIAGIDVAKGRVGGSLAITRFTSYALTMDLLEGELADAVVAGRLPRAEALPLRDRYLPNLAAVVDVSHRLCAGGALALCAIARPPGLYRERSDYMLLVQERSASVINATRQLAVIPKGFHQPAADYRNDARIGATLLREMEEELFGRTDVDSALAEQHAADPMHPARLSEPMRWLLEENPGSLRMECTGFGLNLVSGNFEFACLAVIDSDEFWMRFGGDIEANWESATLRQYSSLDAGSLTELATDDAWSNEGLFAFAQGMRRLRQVGGDRVDIPAIEWEMR